MKLTLPRETLLKPLQRIIGVVERKQQTLPILSNVLLKTQNQTLSITGTDLEVELTGETMLPSDATEAQAVTVPGRKFYDICKALPDDAQIELRPLKEKIILQSGKSRFTLSTLPAEEFPNVEDYQEEIQFSVEQKQLRALIQKTHFAMAQQDVRYYLNGMMIEITPSQLRAVATDGHRLATSTVPASIPIDHKQTVIMPRKGVLELMRLLEDNDEMISLSLGSGHIRVQSKEGAFTSKLIEGRFPDYERVIPRSGDKVIVLDRDILRQALNRSAILCNEKFRGIRFEIDKNTLKLHANNPEQEAAEEELTIDYLGEPLEIAFNVNYLIDVLNTIQSASVRFTFTNSNSSMLIEPGDPDDMACYVVMPMRL